MDHEKAFFRKRLRPGASVQQRHPSPGGGVFAFCAVAFTLLYLRVGYLSRSPGLAQTARREAQAKIVTLKAQYKAVSEASGLKQRAERMVVEGYRTEKNLDLYSKVRYNKDGTVVVTDDWTGKSHPHLSPTYMPNAVVDTLSQNGRQHDRSFYDANGRQVKQISNGPHGNPKRHPYGQQGEHAHDIIWEDGKIVDRPVREITEQERKENADIL